MSQQTELERLNDLYGASEDPWHMRSGWYTERLRDLLMASLQNPRYGSTFVPGCGSGHLIGGLARRSDQVLAADDNREALDEAHERTDHLSHVDVQWRQLPAQWPIERSFDLIVLHDMGYQMDLAVWAELAEAVRNSLRPEATVLACHRQENFAERILETETLHGILDSILGLPRQTRVVDSDFTIDVWTNRAA